jgi:hypothetical protein
MTVDLLHLLHQAFFGGLGRKRLRDLIQFRLALIPLAEFNADGDARVHHQRAARRLPPGFRSTRQASNAALLFLVGERDDALSLLLLLKAAFVCRREFGKRRSGLERDDHRPRVSFEGGKLRKLLVV